MPIDAEVRRLTLACLLLGFVGPTPPRWLQCALADGLGGVVLFGSNISDGDAGDLRALTDSLRDDAGRDVVVAIDEEGGDVTRLERRYGSASPGAAALGALDEPAVTEETYAQIGNRLATAGVTVDLAPVADVNVDARNPVIGVRSFGSDAEAVARQVAAAVRGVQRSGTAACAKHFPGHGATRADTHRQVATLARTADQLRSVEFTPFAAAIGAGVRAIMTGHLVAPAFDPANLATVSPAITTGLLRGELGFTGTVVTDALEMRAVADTIGMADGFVRALAAGADTIETGAVECPEVLEAIPSAVAAALEDGRLHRDRLADAAQRTAALASVGDGISSYDSAAVHSVALRCVTVTGRPPALHEPLVLECRPEDGVASGPLPWSLAEPLATYLPGTEAIGVRRHTDVASIGERARGRSLVVAVRDPQRHAWQDAVLALAAAHPCAVIVDVGWPSPLDGRTPLVRTFGVAPALLAAAAAVLAGKGNP
jgi:beta-N-acetylhexosaminidase